MWIYVVYIGGHSFVRSFVAVQADKNAWLPNLSSMKRVVKKKVFPFYSKLVDGFNPFEKY